MEVYPDRSSFSLSQDCHSFLADKVQVQWENRSDGIHSDVLARVGQWRPLRNSANCAPGTSCAEDLIREVEDRREDGYFLSSQWLLGLEQKQREALMSILSRVGYTETYHTGMTTLFERIGHDVQNPIDGNNPSSVVTKSNICTTDRKQVEAPNEGDAVESSNFANRPSVRTSHNSEYLPEASGDVPIAGTTLTVGDSSHVKDPIAGTTLTVGDSSHVNDPIAASPTVKDELMNLPLKETEIQNSQSDGAGQDLQASIENGDQRASSVCTTPSRYESQKRRDWITFMRYLKNHRLELHQCSGANVLEFLRYLDQFGKTKVHLPSCTFYGVPNLPSPCRCPLRQAWGSLDALIGRLRAAFEEHGGKPESNPFGARLVRLYLREVREMQAKARGVPYRKKKRKCSPPVTSAAVAVHGASTSSNLSNSSSSTVNQQDRLQQQLQQLQQTPPFVSGMQQVPEAYFNFLDATSPRGLHIQAAKFITNSTSKFSLEQQPTKPETLDSFRSELKSSHHHSLAVSTGWLSGEKKDLEAIILEAGYTKIHQDSNTTTFEEIRDDVGLPPRNFCNNPKSTSNTTGVGACDTGLQKASGTGGLLRNDQWKGHLDDEDTTAEPFSVASMVEKGQTQNKDSRCQPQVLKVSCSSLSETSTILSTSSPHDPNLRHFRTLQVGDCVVTMPRKTESLTISTAMERPFSMTTVEFSKGKSTCKEVSVTLKATATTTTSCCLRINPTSKKIRVKFTKISGEVRNETSTQQQRYNALVLSSFRTNVYACVNSEETENESEEVILNLKDGLRTIDHDLAWLEVSGRNPASCEPGSITLELQGDVRRKCKADLGAQAQKAHVLHFQEPRPVVLEGDIPVTLDPNLFLELNVRYQLEVSYIKPCTPISEDAKFVTGRRTNEVIDFNCCLDFMTKKFLFG